MPAPITWESLQMSQDDGRTIGQYIDDQLALHNVDPDAHMDSSGSLASHREAEILDHPDLSVQASHVENAIQAVGKKAGVFPTVGTAWAAAGTVPDDGYTVITFDADVTSSFVAAGTGGILAFSSDCDEWFADALPTADNPSGIAAGNGVIVVANASGGSKAFYVSSDGTSWTAEGPATDVYGLDVLFDGTQFVAVCKEFPFDTSSHPIYTSPDGYTWTATGGTLDTLDLPIVYAPIGDGVYFSTHFNTIAYSYDLVTWDGTGLDSYYYCYTPIWTGYGLLAPVVYDNSDLDPQVVQYYMGSTPDGVITSVVGAQFAQYFGPAIVQGPACVTTCQNLGLPYVAVSNNGQVFTRVQLPLEGDPLDIASDGFRVVVISSGTAGNNIAFASAEEA